MRNALIRHHVGVSLCQSSEWNMQFLLHSAISEEEQERGMKEKLMHSLVVHLRKEVLS